MIDPHVHCRDWSQSYKETVAHCLQVAESQGVRMVFDMPNTSPPILSAREVESRLKLVPRGKEEMYRLYVGLTSDPLQIRDAVEAYDRFDEVVGFKLYAGRSVGPLAVLTESEQRRVWRTLAEVGYGGVVAVHAEKESLLGKWDPTRPITHALARPKEAEIESIRDQLRFAREEGFKGHVHICHISTAEGVELVRKARDASCGVTPHHLMWTDEMLNRPDGLIYKMNPPLRDARTVEKLRELVAAGKVDWVETDHAPHPIGEKLFPPYMSGFPSLYLYRQFVSEFLPSIGLKHSLIEKMTEKNVKNVFGI